MSMGRRFRVATQITDFARSLMGTIKGTTLPARRRLLGKWKDRLRRRFTPRTGSLKTLYCRSSP